MPLVTHILCPVDFSEISRHALEHAGALAASYGARLTVLHVVPTGGEVPEPATAESVVALPPLTREQIRQELLTELEALDAAPSSSSVMVDTGRVHEAVLERIGTLGADLLVLGTHGRSGFQRLFLGSVTEKLLRTAPCPVLTVPPAADARPAARIREVLCATDFSGAARRALAMAVDVAGRSGGRVTLLHALERIVPEGPVVVEASDYREYLLTLARENLHAEVEAVKASGVEFSEVVTASRAYREILERAAAIPADLVVLGAHGHSALDVMFFGSTTQHVVRRATCPVLTVRE